ncbi:MAG: phosphoglycerate kinase [Cytophagia bacterium]|nr:phosphoglycerate kinase [Cytophagia bacterium]
MNYLDNINFKDKIAIVRVDFNVPLTDNLKISDNTRIKKGIESIKHIINKGGKCIIISHLGRPSGKGYEKEYSLENILPSLSKELDHDIGFIKNYFSDDFNFDKLKSDVVLLENLRFYKEEKNNNIQFAKKLASLADVYVNDAFGTCHREHASTNMLPKLIKEKYAGLLIKEELSNINKIINDYKKPFTAILGGAKVSDKILVIEKLIEIADNIIIGGAMSNTFIKAKGGKIGNSLYEKDKLNLSIKILKKAEKNNVNIILPIDSKCSISLNENEKIIVFESDNIDSDYSSFDIGPKSLKIFDSIIKNSKTIIWNGPMGVFENILFSDGTNEIANSITEATENGAFSLVGGGDSISAIKKNNKENGISFISTGGGALLELIGNGNLPALDLLKE